jgi:hypothetical protein
MPTATAVAKNMASFSLSSVWDVKSTYTKSSIAIKIMGSVIKKALLKLMLKLSGISFLSNVYHKVTAVTAKNISYGYHSAGKLGSLYFTPKCSMPKTAKSVKIAIDIMPLKRSGDLFINKPLYYIK